MTNCNVTLALAFGPSEPYVSDDMKVATAVEYTDGSYRVTTAYARIPLTNPPKVVPFPQGGVFSFVQPNGVQKFLLIPNTSSVNYADLVEVVPTVETPGYLGDTVMTAVLEDVDSHFREEIDEIFAESMTGDIADGAVGALINSGAATKDALGDEAADLTSPLHTQLALMFKAQVGYNPKNYGAVGDGASAAADKAGILAMMADINAAVTAGVAGGKIVFPPGEFLLDDTISFLKFSGAIEGQGVGNPPNYSASPGRGTVIRWIGPNTKPMIKLRDYANVDIEGIRFEGNDTTPPTAIIESNSVSGDGAGTGAYLRIEKCALGKSTWSSQGTSKGAAATGVLFSGDNVNNDQYSIKDTQMYGCALGVSVPNSQSTWGVLDNVLISGSTTAGVKTSAALLMLNPQFDNCAIDLQVDSSAAVTSIGWGSERSGRIIDMTSLGRVNVYGGKWLLGSPLTGSSDRFISAPFLTGNAGIYLYGVNINNTLGTHPKLYARGTGGGGASGGFLVFRDGITTMTVADLDVASTGSNALEIDIRSSNLLVRAKYSTATTLTTAGDTFLDAKVDKTALDTDGTLAANSDAKVATQKATKTYVDQIIAAQDAMVFKGVIDCSANPNYPAADRGHTYRVSVAGKIGGASGTVVEAGDLLVCLTDGSAAGTQAAVGANWTIAQTNIDGAVIGPASATDGDFAFYNGSTGKVLKDSGVSLDTDGTLAGNSDTRVPTQKAVKTYAQPLDADLSDIAAETATTDNVLQSVGGHWKSRTMAQLKAVLALVKGDVGLGNVDNTSDANKPVSTAQNLAMSARNRVWLTGKYYGVEGAHIPGTVAQGDGLLTAIPFWVHVNNTPATIACEVTTAAGAGNVRMGIYGSNTNDQPSGAPIVDAGVVAATSTGVKEIAISQALTPGLYWLVVGAQGGNPTLRSIGTASQPPVISGAFTGSAGTAGMNCYYMTGVSGALPTWSGTNEGSTGYMVKVKAS